MSEKSARQMVTEVPSSLKQLARFVVRGFYTIEDALIVDMLVRYPCLREEDLANLLKFDRKMLRMKIAALKNDKIIQVKQRIETDKEGKVSRMNCYYINYRIFVNIVKYKLDHIHKKMEINEQDACNRSNFKCTGCQKTFTDLEANQLFDPFSGEFKCTFCSSSVEEDEASGPQTDSRQLLAKFNTQVAKLYDLLRIVENFSLSPDLLDPEPFEIDMFDSSKKPSIRSNDPSKDGEKWSGESTRNVGLRADDQHVSITFGETSTQAETKKDMPSWMQNSTVVNPSSSSLLGFEDDSNSMDITDTTMNLTDSNDKNNEQSDEITLLLLKHENRDQGIQGPIIPKDSDSDKSADSDSEFNPNINSNSNSFLFGIGNDTNMSTFTETNDPETMSDDEEEDGDIPTVRVGDEEITVTDVTKDIIDRMTSEEKEKYTQVYQDFYAHVYD